MELHSIFRLLRERWMLILSVTLLASAAGVVLTYIRTPIYAAQTTLYVSTWSSGDNVAAAYQGGLAAEQKAKSYAALIRSERVMTEVATQLGLHITAGQLATKVSAVAVLNTSLLNVIVTDVSPSMAQRIADAVGETFVRQVVTLESTPDGRQPAVRVSVVTPAELPATPISPVPVRDIGIAVVLGLLAGFGLAAARRSLDTSIKSTATVESVSGAPSLGVVALDLTAPGQPLFIHATGGPRAEAYRRIRTNLQFVEIDRSVKTLIVTSSVAGEGKTLTSCNLALALAEGGKSVLLIDADLRRPSVATYMGLPNGIGLTNVLVGQTTFDQAAQIWGAQQITVLASGPRAPNPTTLVGSRQMVRLLADLRDRFDVVIVDAPPVLPVADAVATAPACDGIVMVVRYGRTKNDQFDNAIKALRSTEVPILGTVLNGAPAKGATNYYDYRYQPATKYEGRLTRAARATRSAPARTERPSQRSSS